MMYELRVYRAEAGRTADQAIWVESAIRIASRLGFRIVGCWTDVDPGRENELTYILAWESMEQRDEGFKALNADPEFKVAFAASRANGSITASVTKTFLRPTHYSALT